VGGGGGAGGRGSRAAGRRRALVRELREELGVTVEVGDRIGPDVPIAPDLLLRAWTAVLADGEPAALEHAELRWLAPDELDTVAWLPADRPIITTLVTRQPEPGPRP
jgi:8-oxo-dGTP diphosphatase